MSAKPRTGITSRFRIEYQTWKSMKRRCTNPRDASFKYYGAKGITVCDRWMGSFEAFLEDMGRRPSARHSIDRFPNSDGNYEPGNCRWALAVQQARNRKSYNHVITVNGVSRCLAEWAELAGVGQETIRGRLQLGWPPELAVSLPPCAGTDRFGNKRMPGPRERRKIGSANRTNRSSGVCGVTWHSRSNKWQARAFPLGSKSKPIYLGLFDTVEKAKGAIAEWEANRA